MCVNKRQDGENGEYRLFKASQIRRGLSYAAIMSKLNANEEKEQQLTINSQAHQIQISSIYPNKMAFTARPLDAFPRKEGLRK